LPGVVGAVVSGAVLGVSGALGSDSLPSASTALTRNENSPPGIRWVIVFAGGTGEPQMQ
jgi:hypothetical protein